MARSNSTGIDTITKRRNLAPRRNPYFHKLALGRYIGFRKLKDGGNWIARIMPEGSGYKFHALGSEVDHTFEEAVELANKWFAQIGQMEPKQDHRYTVKSCVADYVSHLKVENGDKSSKAVKQSLEKHLVPKLGKVELVRLTTAQIKRWRDGLVKVSDDPEVVRKSKDTANRVLSISKAAFNLAFRSGLAGSDTAWRRVAAFKGVGENRKLFLTETQVDSLLEAASDGFKLLIRGAILTGARYGELATARVHDLDVINGTLRLDGKTGPRDCYLSDDALKFFKGVSKNRLPSAFLLVKDDGAQWGKSHQHRLMKEAIRAAQLPADTVFYSLRHYHISKALMAHIPAQVIAENCGTSIRMLEKHYAKFMATDRRKMMNQVML
ncbi:MAG: tyrosine-type recombinase/integrase [Candidatus Sedimenticola sp. 6PFRAG7]